jgi:hypothetical protein
MSRKVDERWGVRGLSARRGNENTTHFLNEQNMRVQRASLANASSYRLLYVLETMLFTARIVPADGVSMLDAELTSSSRQLSL